MHFYLGDINLRLMVVVMGLWWWQKWEVVATMRHGGRQESNAEPHPGRTKVGPHK